MWCMQKRNMIEIGTGTGSHGTHVGAELYGFCWVSFTDDAVEG